MLTFAPDADPSTPGVIVDGASLRPTVAGYANYPTTSAALVNNAVWPTTTAAPISMYAHQYSAQDGRVIIAAQKTDTTWDLLEGRTPSIGAALTLTSRLNVPAVSMSGFSGDEGYSTAWSFASFGGVIIAARHGGTALYAQTAPGGSFAAIAGSPAGAGSLCVFKKFLIAFDCGAYGVVPAGRDLVAWSALDDYTNFTPSIATQSDFFNVNDVAGRNVCGLPLGDVILIYKQQGIIVMRYEDSTNPFGFEPLRDSKGICADPTYPPPVVNIGGMHLFIGQDDVYVCDGASVRSVTEGVIREYIRNNYSSVGRLTNTPLGHDPSRGEVYFYRWRSGALAAPGGLVYNYRLNRWGVLPNMDLDSNGVVAACRSNRATVVDDHGSVIGHATTLFIESNGTLFPASTVKNHYRDSGTTWSTMHLQPADLGSNQSSLHLTRVLPRFRTAPNGTGTLAHTSLPALGAPAVGDAGGLPAAVWDATSKRFDLVRDAYWHRNVMTFPSTAEMEIIDVEYSVVKAGRKVEFVTG